MIMIMIIICSVEDLFSDRIDLFLPCPNSQNDKENNEERYVANPKYRESSDAVAMYEINHSIVIDHYH